MRNTYDRDLRLLYTDKPRGEQPLKMKCPWHHDTDASLALYRDHAYCFGCRKWVGYVEFEKEIGEAPVATFVEEKQPELTREEIVGFAHTYHARLFRSNKQDYYQARGLNEDTVRKYLLGYAARAYTIPVWNAGEIESLRFRRDDAVNTDGSKYWGLPGHNRVMVFAPTGFGDRVVWCEGELDCLVLTQLGYSAFTLTNGIGADPTPFLPLLAQCQRVTLAQDCDFASYHRSLAVAKQITEAHPDIDVRIAQWSSAKDVSELYVKRGEQAVRKAIGR